MILFYLILLAALAAAIFFSFPRIYNAVTEFAVELGAIVYNAAQDAAQEWKELLKAWRGGNG